jgi:hypothetical protein
VSEIWLDHTAVVSDFFTSDKEVDMARKPHTLSPEVAEQLAQVAREMRLALYGPDGVPVWGTKFIEIEEQGLDVGLELARLFMEQSVAGQAQGDMPAEALGEQQGEAPQRCPQDFESTLETPAGEIHSTERRSTPWRPSSRTL